MNFVILAAVSDGASPMPVHIWEATVSPVCEWQESTRSKASEAGPCPWISRSKPVRLSSRRRDLQPEREEKKTST